MPYNFSRLRQLSMGWRIFALSVGWLIFISILHYSFSVERETRRVVRLGYMPVISNLAAPLLDYVSRNQGKVRFEAVKFSSFAELGNALRNDQIDAAFMIAPLSIVLRQQGEEVKVVFIGNRHESTLVARAELNATSLSHLAGKTVAVPLRHSGHYLSIHQLMEDQGLMGQINVVEMNPPDMAAALAAGSLDAYYVGEPFAAKTLRGGIAKRVFYVEEVWPGFICNLAVVKQRLIKKEPAIVELLVEGAARSGLWAMRNYREAAQIASTYWNQPIDLVEYAMNTPENRIRYDLFVPKQEEMQKIADLMVRFHLIADNQIAGLVEDRFAKAAHLDGVTDSNSILRRSLSP